MGVCFKGGTLQKAAARIPTLSAPNESVGYIKKQLRTFPTLRSGQRRVMWIGDPMLTLEIKWTGTSIMPKKAPTSTCCSTGGKRAVEHKLTEP